jgi:hypothetical protein
VIPFSGAAMAADPTLRPWTVYSTRTIDGTGVSWEQAVKILPADPIVRDVIVRIESNFEGWLAELTGIVPHLPSRLRSLLWILSAIPELEPYGFDLPSRLSVAEAMVKRLPRATSSASAVWAMAGEKRVV